MTGGFATIAGWVFIARKSYCSLYGTLMIYVFNRTVMAAYISFGVKADSLLAASVMAAPCALALSKLMYPETEESRTTTEKIKHAQTKLV